MQRYLIAVTLKKGAVTAFFHSVAEDEQRAIAIVTSSEGLKQEMKDLCKNAFPIAHIEAYAWPAGKGPSFSTRGAFRLKSKAHLSQALHLAGWGEAS